MGALVTWTLFGILSAVIAVAGTVLTREGDVIAQETGVGGTWVGVALIATVTSLPELATGISAVSLAAAPDIAVGDALGSCVFNLLLIVLLDGLHRPESFFLRVGQGHVLAAAFGIVLIGLVAFHLPNGAEPPALGFVGLYTPILVGLYLLAVRMVFRHERAGRTGEAPPAVQPLGRVLARFALAALAVVLAGSLLPFVGERIAELMGWRQSFVGTLFIALATSLPEIVVSVTAVRIGAVDMAIADLFGSNLFDMLVLAVDDLFWTRGPLLADVSPAHRNTAVAAMMMTGIAMVGLLVRPKGRVLRTVGWTSLFLLVVYLVNAYVLHGQLD